MQKRTTSLRSDKSGEGGSNQFLNLLNADDLEASIETGKKRRRKIVLFFFCIFINHSL